MEAKSVLTTHLGKVQRHTGFSESMENGVLSFNVPFTGVLFVIHIWNKMDG
jgi:hypothetical protein